MALSSCMGDEKTRAEEVKRIVEKEEREPLYIKTEQINSMVVISNHNIISNDAQIVLRYLDTQEHAILHFENTLRLLGSESQKACQRRWSNLPHYLRIRENHSDEMLINALEGTPLYKNSMDILNIN